MPNGITYNRTASGKPASVTISLKKYGAFIEDLLDRAEMDKFGKEPVKPLRKVISRLDKNMALKGQHDYTVVITKQAQKNLADLPKNYYHKISEHLLQLEQDPFPHGTIKLQGSKKRLSFTCRCISYFIHS